MIETTFHQRPATRGGIGPYWLRKLVPNEPEAVQGLQIGLLRILIVTTLLLGTHYIVWRYLHSINWAMWPFAFALLAAETYSYIDSCLFCLTIWRLRLRSAPPPPPAGATVDIFITCYNEPVELVRRTAAAARQVRWPHRTYILDDGNSPAMCAMAETEGIGYITRAHVWRGKERHAKAGNLINAINQTNGEFFLILDADQVPAPEILERTLGYFHDPKVAFVQTPQWFWNTPLSDPFGTDAPLFYGPLQQGKDGWNAAFFCGSNAVLRREALMHCGVVFYVRELEQRVHTALRTAGKLLRNAERQLLHHDHVRPAIQELRAAVSEARQALRCGEPIQLVTWEFQRRAEEAGRILVQDDLAQIQADLADIPGLEEIDLDQGFSHLLGERETVDALAGRVSSPLAAVAAIRGLLMGIDMDRAHEAEPVLPLATISVTEDMATAMRLHALGWRSVYHHEVLAFGLAPEDLHSALQQRLRWAQGTIQVLLRENPLTVRGLSLGQRLMYFATMWSYLSGFFSVIYLVSPVLYLLLGLLPVRAYEADFFWHLLPYLAINQLLFLFVGWGLPTWRGQQYSLALFPLWIKAVLTTLDNVYRGKKLGFVVTPKTRQGGLYLGLVRPQLLMMGLLYLSVVVGLVRLAFGLTEDGVPILVNVAWAVYDLVMLSAVLDAATYQPGSE